MRSRIDRLKSGSLRCVAHTAIATTSCVALDCVGTECALLDSFTCSCGALKRHSLCYISGKWLRPIFNPFLKTRFIYRTEIKPGKKNPDTDTRKKAVAFGQRPRPLHNRYIHPNGHCACWAMAVSHSRYNFVTTPLPKRSRDGRFVSEAATATWVQMWFKIPAGTSRELQTQRDVTVIAFLGGSGDDGRGHRNMCKTPGGWKWF